MVGVVEVPGRVPRWIESARRVGFAGAFRPDGSVAGVELDGLSGFSIAHGELPRHDRRGDLGWSVPGHSRIWWTFGLELARCGGRVAQVAEVTALAAVLEESELSEFLGLTPAQLLTVVLAPISFWPGPVELGPRLATLARVGLTPPNLVAYCLIADRARALVSDLSEVIDP